MTTTGIIRRIDDLGRIIIPREIRKNLEIKVGDPLEIFSDSQTKQIIIKLMVNKPDYREMWEEVKRKQGKIITTKMLDEIEENYTWL